MILGNKTLMCPRRIFSEGLEDLPHDTPLIISTRLDWNSYGPTIKISLTCPDCGWETGLKDS